MKITSAAREHLFLILGSNIWIYKNDFNLGRAFRKQRKRVSHKLGNSRLVGIDFHTSRHWKASVEYTKTKDILYVQKLLGHRSLKTTLRYTQLIVISQNEEYICKVAKDVDGAKELIEAGIEYATDLDSYKLLRKMKTSHLGS